MSQSRVAPPGFRDGTKHQTEKALILFDDQERPHTVWGDAVYKPEGKHRCWFNYGAAFSGFYSNGVYTLLDLNSRPLVNYHSRDEMVHHIEQDKDLPVLVVTMSKAEAQQRLAAILDSYDEVQLHELFKDDGKTWPRLINLLQTA